MLKMNKHSIIMAMLVAVIVALASYLYPAQDKFECVGADVALAYKFKLSTDGVTYDRSELVGKMGSLDGRSTVSLDELGIVNYNLFRDKVWSANISGEIPELFTNFSAEQLLLHGYKRITIRPVTDNERPVGFVACLFKE